MKFKSLLFFVFVLATALMSFGQNAKFPSRITQPVNENNLTTLKGNIHPNARAEFDRGAAPASLPMGRMLLLLQHSPEQESAIKKMLDQQQDKSSPNYHHWLSPEQFGEQFGPSTQDVQAVTTWLQSHGFEVSLRHDTEQRLDRMPQERDPLSSKRLPEGLLPTLGK